MIKKILLAASVLYLILGLVTYHPDNKSVLKWIANDYVHVWNIYAHTEQVFKDSVFNYPPMNFLIAKLEWPMAYLIGGNGYYSWLNQNDEVAVYDPLIFRYALATKFPLILAGLFVGWQIYELSLYLLNDKKRAILASCLWLFNPVTIFSIPIMGQNDVFAIAFFLAGWRLLYKNTLGSSLLFGLSISVKSYPLIWLIFLLFTQWDRTWKKKIAVLAMSYLVYFLTTIPFLSTPAFTKYVLNSSINNRFFIAQIDIGQEESLLIVPILLFVMFIVFNFQRYKYKLSEGYKAWILIVVNFILLGWSHFHPQWFTWIIPFWAIWVTSINEWKKIKSVIFLSAGVLLIWFLVIVLFNDKFLTWGMLTPLNPNLINLPVIVDFLTLKGMDTKRLVNSAHSALAGTSILTIIISVSSYIFKEKLKLSDIKLTLPKVSFSMKVVGLLMPLIFIYILFFISFLIPAPVGILTSKAPKYVVLSDKFSGMFTAKFDGLNRIELFFRNPGLKSADTYTFMITSDNNNVYSTKASAFNSGDPSILRFEFPPIIKSMGKEFDLTVVPVATSGAERLHVGVDSNTNELLFRQYYDTSISVPTAIQFANERFLSLARQSKWLLVIVELSTGLLLFGDDLRKKHA